MTIRYFFAALMLALCVPAAAEFTTISRAYEVPLNLFNVPVTRNGRIAVKQCDDCTLESGRLTADTQFIINGRPVELTEFRKSVFSIRDRDAATVVVLHHLETDTISSISLTL